MVFQFVTKMLLFVTKMLDNKVKEIEANTEKAIDLLSHDKQALWTVL